MTGRAWVFSGRVTTDDILPGRFLDRSADEVAEHVLSGRDPGFAARVRPGDFVVGGDDFGAGSGRENAVWALKRAGVRAVVARSIARVFHRNCTNLGLPALAVEDALAIATGDLLELDLGARLLRRGAATHRIQNLGGVALEILEAGGIVPYTLAHRQEGP